jgi:predicted nucleic acid-binding protein
VVTRVLPDANVLHSRTLRDWLFMLGIEGSGEMFNLYYTVDILAETINTIRRQNPNIDGAQMTLAIHDRIVNNMTDRITDYPPAPDAPVRDEHDRHVHAAAVGGRVDILLTCDTDFLQLDDEIQDSLPYDIYTPDAFFVLADDSWPEVVQAVTDKQHKYWTGKGTTNITAQLSKAGCPEFADRIRRHLQALFG